MPRPWPATFCAKSNAGRRNAGEKGSTIPRSYMMALGDYRFSLSTAAYQELNRSAEYRWQSQERLQRRPAQQYLGPGREEITLNGTIYPAFRGGLEQLDRMRGEAGKGESLLLVDGTGRVWGQWVITQVEETHRVPSHDGTPRQLEFRLQLARYGEDVA